MIFADCGSFKDTTTTTPSAFDRLSNPHAAAVYDATGVWSEWDGARLVTS